MSYEEFMKTSGYDKFIKENPEKGNLKVRVYAFNEAMPIKDVNIVVSKIIDNIKVVFYDGYTDSSGVIEKISLPTPELNTDNMIKPAKITYDINASKDNLNGNYEVSLYEGVCVVQNIKFIPGDMIGY